MCECARVVDVQRLFVGREGQAVGQLEVVHEQVHRTVGIDAVDAVVRLLLALGQVAQAVWRIGKEHLAVGSHHDVVGRVEPLALERVGQRLHVAVRIDARHAASRVLAGDQVAFEVERQAVGVPGGIAERGDLGTFRQGSVAHGSAVRDIREQQVVAAPHRAFSKGKPAGDTLQHAQQSAEEGIRVLEAILHTEAYRTSRVRHVERARTRRPARRVRPLGGLRSRYGR